MVYFRQEFFKCPGISRESSLAQISIICSEFMLSIHMLNLLIKYDDEMVFMVTQQIPAKSIRTRKIYRQTNKRRAAIYPETDFSLAKISSGDKIALIGIGDQIYN